MDEAMLKVALEEMQEYEVSQYPLPTEEDMCLPFWFKIRMNRLMEKHDHPVWYTVKRITVIVFILIWITGSVVLGFDKKVRANVWNWITERMSNNMFHYREQSNKELDVSGFTLEGNVPDGYWFIKRSDNEDMITEIYRNDEGDLLTFMVMGTGYDGETYLVSDEDKMNDPVYVASLSAELYLSQTQGEASTITWQDTNGTRFIIQGVMDANQLIELANIFYK